MNHSGKVFPEAIKRFVADSKSVKSEICVHPGLPVNDNGEVSYRQEWVNRWIKHHNRFLELKAMKFWNKKDFESEFSVTLRPFRNASRDRGNAGSSLDAPSAPWPSNQRELSPESVSEEH